MKLEIKKEFAHKMGLMIESRLIWYKHYYLWCDEIIDQCNEPPYWVIELATVKFIPNAVSIVNKYAYSEPFEKFDRSNDLYMACLFIKYDRNEISWATFLEAAGYFSDGNYAKVDCSYFYILLDEYQDSGFVRELEKIQKEKIYNEFSSEIHEMYGYYKPFVSYYNDYVKSEKIKKNTIA